MRICELLAKSRGVLAAIRGRFTAAYFRYRSRRTAPPIYYITRQIARVPARVSQWRTITQRSETSISHDNAQLFQY